MTFMMNDLAEMQSAKDLPLAPEQTLSDVGDGSSSLSEIEDKDTAQDELDSLASESESESELDRGKEDDVHDDSEDSEENDRESELNDSEAETERLENSPHTLRRHKDVFLSSRAEKIYERSPSKLQYQFGPDDEGEEEGEDIGDELSDEQGSADEYKKELAVDDAGDDVQEPREQKTSAPSPALRRSLSIMDHGSKKRKRSLMPETHVWDAEDVEEPDRKRTGSVTEAEIDRVANEVPTIYEDLEPSNLVGRDISDDSSTGGLEQENDEEDIEGVVGTALNTGSTPDDIIEAARVKGERARALKTRRSTGLEDQTPLQSEDGVRQGATDRLSNAEIDDALEQEEGLDNEHDEVDVAARNEEEQEKKRVAQEQLGDIEKHFSSFRDRLHEERIAQLDLEEAMLRADTPTHPRYLQMMRCVDARRAEKLRISSRLTHLKLETLQRSAVGKRSQILSQCQQEIRASREKKLEVLGKQWYDIQHDRRAFGPHVEDYGIKFPEKRSQQVLQHNAYTKEVSLLSGIAKYVGFPAAPTMSAATQPEIESDFEKMGKLQQPQHIMRPQLGLHLQEMAALRAITSSAKFKPAEEQFIEQTPWANPQHPAHAHLLQRQSSMHQTARTTSPFASASGVRRHSHQHAAFPMAGTFSSAGTMNAAHTPNFMQGGRLSPLNPMTANSLPQKPGPSPLHSRRASVSPDQAQIPTHNGNHLAMLRQMPQDGYKEGTLVTPHDVPFEELSSPRFSYGDNMASRREPNVAIVGRF